MDSVEKKIKQPKIFISHATADKDYIKEFVDLLEVIGIRGNQLFCSSVSGYDIPEGEDIYDYLKEQFNEYSLHMFYMLSEEYYKSPAALNEMGAAWILGQNYTTILLPGYTYEEIKGAVNPNKISASLDEGNIEIRNHLTQIKRKLEEEFKLNPLSEPRWDEKLNEFIEKIEAIKNNHVIETKEQRNEQNRMPNLKINLGSGKIIKYKEIQEFSENLIWADYSKLTMEDVIESGVRVSQEKLDKYNSSLPTNEAIKEYINKCKDYLFKTTAYSGISLSIENEGTCKANDIHIELKFPKEIFILEEDKIPEIEKPKAPQKPKNPIDEAYLNSPIGQWEKALINFEDPWDFSNLSNINDLVKGLTANTEFTIEGNCIEFSIKDLQHKRALDYNQFAIAAVKRGSYQVECTIMCDEYEAPMIQQISIDVV